MKQKRSPVSLRDIAKVAGVSKSTVGYVLQSHPRVSNQTRQRVLKIAGKLGYIPDPRIASWMAKIRDAARKELVTLAWLNCHDDQDAWQKYKFLSPYLEGARSEALRLGYQIEEIWAHEPRMTMRRISQIIYQRGIQGVIVTHYTRHFRLNWELLAAVSLEGQLLAPRLNKISTDLFYNFLLALKMVKRLGFRRIGICLEDILDRQTNQAVGAMAREFSAASNNAGSIPPLFYAWSGTQRVKAEKEILRWLRRHKPDVVLGHSDRLVDWVQSVGLRVPQDTGVVHLAIDDDVEDWAGIYSNRRAIGAATAQAVITSIQNGLFGIPKIATNTLIRGAWRDGRTLLRLSRNSFSA